MLSRLPWLVILFWLALVALTIFGMLVPDPLPFGLYPFVETAFVAFMFGQIALATVVGGLMARSWIASWLLAVILASLQALMIAAVMRIQGDHSELEFQMPLPLLWPILFLITGCPLFLFRGISGWTLTREPLPLIPRRQVTLEHLVQLGVVIACSITICQAYLYVLPNNSLSVLFILVPALGAMSLICLLPAVYITFRSQTWTSRLIGWLVVSMVTLVAISVCHALFDGDWRAPFVDFVHMFVGWSVGCLTVAAGFICLLASGYHMTRFAKSSEAIPTAELTSANAQNTSTGEVVDLPSSDQAWLSDQQPLTKKPRDVSKLQARVATAIVVLLAAISGFAVRYTSQRYVDFFQEWTDSGLAGVYTQDGQVYGLHFGPDFTDADLDKYVALRESIAQLSFAGTKITDAILPKLVQFNRLAELNLSNTAITDAGLLQLEVYQRERQNKSWLFYLSLANTKVTYAGCVKLAERMSIENLDVSGLQITDDQLDQPILVKGLKLARNPITEAGLAKLLEHNRLHKLDISDTPIAHPSFTFASCPRSLILDGTGVDDSTLRAILKIRQVSTLSIMDTQVTAAVLPELGGLSLRLGKGAITDDDLSKLPPTEFKHLGLNDKQFTGACMKTRNLTANSLDLSGSSVNDDILYVISNTQNPFHFLGLADTQVTNAGMLHVHAEELDLRRSAVTANGVGNHGGGTRIIITRNQFTAEQKAIFLRKGTQIDEQPLRTYGPR